MRGTLNDWDWPVAPSAEQHSERYAMTRPIPYETIAAIQEDDAFVSQSVTEQRGKALSINISSGGMLILMDRAPTIGQVLKVLVPTPVHPARTPTLAEVRWIRKLPFYQDNGLHFVGLKFLF
jgi:hypothetical protein